MISHRTRLWAFLAFFSSGALAQESPPATPAHGSMPREGSQTRANPSDKVPTGAIRVQLWDENRTPVSGGRITLETITQTVIEGISTRTKELQTGKDGVVQFGGLDVASTHSFRLSSQRGGGRFASPIFNLPTDRGYEVVLQVFPTSGSLADLPSAVGLLLYLQPKPDVFRVEVLLDLEIAGRSAWQANQRMLRLPEGAKAFVAEENPGGPMLKDQGRELFLEGTLAPGRHRVTARFDLPAQTNNLLPFSQSSQSTFHFDLPPQLARFTLAVEHGPETTLSSPQLPPAVRDRSPNQKPVLVSAWEASATSPTLAQVDFTLAGLPVRGAFTGWAVLAAALLGVVGLGGVFSRQADPDLPKRRQGLTKAVLSELVLVERAHERGVLGPDAYKRLNRQLLELCAHLLPDASVLPKASKAKGRQQRQPQ